jgi:hypothetical protein
MDTRPRYETAQDSIQTHTTTLTNKTTVAAADSDDCCYMHWINSSMHENDEDKDKDDAMMRKTLLMNAMESQYEMIKE